jgi:hypothetical protein
MKRSLTIERHKKGLTIRIGRGDSKLPSRVRQPTADSSPEDDDTSRKGIKSIRCTTFDKPMPLPNSNPFLYRSRFIFFK